MKITLDIPDGIIAGFFNGVEVTPFRTWQSTSPSVTQR